MFPLAIAGNQTPAFQGKNQTLGQSILPVVIKKKRFSGLFRAIDREKGSKGYVLRLK